MRRAVRWSVAALLVLLALPPAANAQVTVDERCRNATAGLVLGMQTHRETGSSREVALERSGLAPGGVRYRVADEAYGQLAAGTPVAAVMDRARAQCRQIGPDAFEDDAATFETSREAGGRGGGAQLCGDVADSVAALFFDDPATRTMSLDDALQVLRNGDPRDIETPQLRRVVDLAQQRARVSPNRQELQQFVFRYCDGLETAAREALDRELYVP